MILNGGEPFDGHTLPSLDTSCMQDLIKEVASWKATLSAMTPHDPTANAEAGSQRTSKKGATVSHPASKRVTTVASIVEKWIEEMYPNSSRGPNRSLSPSIMSIKNTSFDSQEVGETAATVSTGSVKAISSIKRKADQMSDGSNPRSRVSSPEI